MTQEDEYARFEALLAQVLTTDEDARRHVELKQTRGSARQNAVTAKAVFEINRERPRKARRRELRRQG